MFPPVLKRRRDLISPASLFYGEWCGTMQSMTELNTASFLASIPPIMSGIKTGGDGMRIQFDVPETEMGEGVKLLAMRGKRLRVTVQVTNEEELSHSWGIDL